MADWMWVAAGFGLVYATVVAYAGWLAARLRQLARDTDEQDRR